MTSIDVGVLESLEEHEAGERIELWDQPRAIVCPICAERPLELKAHRRPGLLRLRE
jgi:hypothetical protein